MKFNRGGIVITLLIIAGAMLALALGGWVWVLTWRNPLDHFLGRRIAWPVACSARGCVTTQDWQQNLRAREMFAKALAENPPGATEALTTAIRHHLVNQAFLSAAVNQEDARRYRREILRLEDEQLVKETTGMTLEAYDEVVLMPLLRQEALRQQYQVATFEDLYVILAKEKKVVVLPFRLSWNQGEAKVQED